MMLKKIISWSILLSSPLTLHALNSQISGNHTQYKFNKNDLNYFNNARCTNPIILDGNNVTISGYITMYPAISHTIQSDQILNNININNPEDKIFDMKIIGENRAIILSTPFYFKNLIQNEYDLGIIGTKNLNIFGNISTNFGKGNINIDSPGDINIYSHLFSSYNTSIHSSENINIYARASIISENDISIRAAHDINIGINRTEVTASTTEYHKIYILGRNPHLIEFTKQENISGAIQFCFDNIYQNFIDESIIGELVIDAVKTQ